MTFARLGMLLWIALWLGAVETALEYRAYRRGYDTPLFGTATRTAPTDAPLLEAAEFGPTDEFPFRSPVVSIDPIGEVGRYWIASASYAEDAPLHPSLIFPTRLAERLRVEGQIAQVLNASHAGNDIAANQSDFNRIAPLWRPDVVILYQMSVEIDRLSSEYLAEAATGVILEGAQLRQAPSWTTRVIESTTTWMLIKRNITPWLVANRILADRLPPPAGPDFEGRVRDFVAAVRRLGAVPVLCTFATSHLRRDLGRIPWETQANLYRRNNFLSMRGWVESVETLNASIVQVAREQDLPLVDVAGAVGGRPELFRDFVHFTAEGHQLVADAITDALLRYPSPVHEAR